MVRDKALLRIMRKTFFYVKTVNVSYVIVSFHIWWYLFLCCCHYRVVIWFLQLPVTPDLTTLCLSERRCAFWRSLRPSCCASGPTSPDSTKWRYVLRSSSSHWQMSKDWKWQLAARNELNSNRMPCWRKMSWKDTLYLATACHSLWWLWKRNAQRRKIFTPVFCIHIIFVANVTLNSEKLCEIYVCTNALWKMLVKK